MQNNTRICPVILHFYCESDLQSTPLPLLSQLLPFSWLVAKNSFVVAFKSDPGEDENACRRMGRLILLPTHHLHTF